MSSLSKPRPAEPKPVELITPRLLLWMPRSEHAGEMVQYQQDNRRHLGRWSPSTRQVDLYTIELWQKRLARAWREYADGSSVRFVISRRDQEPRRIIGTCNLTNIIRGPRQSCALGYGLDEQEQSKGFMTEALRAIIDYAFESLELHRIPAHYMPSNSRSAAVLKRLGFTVEGYARDYLFVNGAWRDFLLTALTNPRPIAPAL